MITSASTKQYRSGCWATLYFAASEILQSTLMGSRAPDARYSLHTTWKVSEQFISLWFKCQHDQDFLNKSDSDNNNNADTIEEIDLNTGIVAPKNNTRRKGESNGIKYFIKCGYKNFLSERNYDGDKYLTTCSYSGLVKTSNIWRFRTPVIKAQPPRSSHKFLVQDIH